MTWLAALLVGAAVIAAVIAAKRDIIATMQTAENARRRAEEVFDTLHPVFTRSEIRVACEAWAASHKRVTEFQAQNVPPNGTEAASNGAPEWLVVQEECDQEGMDQLVTLNLRVFRGELSRREALRVFQEHENIRESRIDRVIDPLGVGALVD